MFQYQNVSLQVHSKGEKVIISIDLVKLFYQIQPYFMKKKSSTKN